ncbi:1186_t:CDS:2 [Gigaspora margarita]|uniref:1186_t:CDS:1 n=1 Tax=Gigaspora margarita TaxID=4874 RepID=A0ABN7UPC0_GIGMA|nr:1186_t:CDS:2 [Gigaspora margarita]
MSLYVISEIVAVLKQDGFLELSEPSTTMYDAGPATKNEIEQPEDKNVTQQSDYTMYPQYFNIFKNAVHFLVMEVFDEIAEGKKVTDDWFKGLNFTGSWITSIIRKEYDIRAKIRDYADEITSDLLDKKVIFKSDLKEIFLSIMASDRLINILRPKIQKEYKEYELIVSYSDDFFALFNHWLCIDTVAKEILFKTRDSYSNEVLKLIREELQLYDCTNDEIIPYLNNLLSAKGQYFIFSIPFCKNVTRYVRSIIEGITINRSLAYLKQCLINIENDVKSGEDWTLKEDREQLICINSYAHLFRENEQKLIALRNFIKYCYQAHRIENIKLACEKIISDLINLLFN